MKQFFYIIAFCGLSSFFLACKGVEAQTVNVDQYLNEKTQLEQVYTDILDYTEYNRCIEYNKDKTCITTEPTIQYIYNTKLPLKENIISKNTIQLSDLSFKIYSGDTFYKNEDNTYSLIETGNIEKNSYDNTLKDKLTFWKKINNPFGIYTVKADGYFSGGGDGRCSVNGTESWATQRAKSSAANCYYTGDTSEYIQSSKIGADRYLTRMFLPFDTSALSDTGIEISSSTMYLRQNSYTENDAGASDGFLVEASQASPTSLTNDDFNNMNTTLLSDGYIDASAGNSQKTLTLNTAGKSFINFTGYTLFALRARYDLADTPEPTAANDLYIRMSNYTGTASDPYLLVDFASTTPPEEPPATTTPVLIPVVCATSTFWSLYNYLDFVTGCTEHYSPTSSTSTLVADWVEYHYFHIPFILWIVIAVVVIIAFYVLFKEFKHRLKK